MINAAVFGAGRIGKVHTHNIAGLPGVALRYVVDVNPVAASELGVDPTVVSPAAISITAAPAERSCQGRTAHTGSRAEGFCISPQKTPKWGYKRDAAMGRNKRRHANARAEAPSGGVQK